jgi:hypothetical protein
MSTLSRRHDEVNARDSDSPGRWRHESWDWCAGSWRSDRLDSIGWAAVFLWAALVLLAEAAGYRSSSGWWDGWGAFFAGAGAIVLLEAAVRLLLPEYRSTWWWSLIVGSVLLGIGLDSWDGWAWIWALVMAAIGVVILRGVFARGA